MHKFSMTQFFISFILIAFLQGSLSYTHEAEHAIKELSKTENVPSVSEKSDCEICKLAHLQVVPHSVANSNFNFNSPRTKIFSDIRNFKSLSIVDYDARAPPRFLVFKS